MLAWKLGDPWFDSWWWQVLIFLILLMYSIMLYLKIGTRYLQRLGIPPLFLDLKETSHVAHALTTCFYKIYEHYVKNCITVYVQFTESE